MTDDTRNTRVGSRAASGVRDAILGVVARLTGILIGREHLPAALSNIALFV